MEKRKTFYDIYEKDVRPECTTNKEKNKTDMFDVTEEGGDHNDSGKLYTEQDLNDIIEKKLNEQLLSMGLIKNEEEQSNGDE